MSAPWILDPAEIEVERHREPIIAWRTWALRGRRNGSDPALCAVAKRVPAWRPHEPARAACRYHRSHVAPEVRCTCGLHGAAELRILRRTKHPAVLGRVALWGRVIEHEHGYRARFAYPQRLRLICRFCFWQWGPLGRVPDLVGWFPPDDLIPMCEPHVATARRHGMRARDALPARAVELALRERYAVDPLAI